MIEQESRDVFGFWQMICEKNRAAFGTFGDESQAVWAVGKPQRDQPRSDQSDDETSKHPISAERLINAFGNVQYVRFVGKSANHPVSMIRRKNLVQNILLTKSREVEDEYENRVRWTTMKDWKKSSRKMTTMRMMQTTDVETDDDDEDESTGRKFLGRTRKKL